MLSIAISGALENNISNDLLTATSVDKMLHVDNLSDPITSSREPTLSDSCKINIFRLLVAFLILWSVALIVEVAIIFVSLRGTILQAHLRWPVEHMLYVKLGRKTSGIDSITNVITNASDNYCEI